MDKIEHRRPGRGYRGKGDHRGGHGVDGGLPDTWVNGHAASYVVKYINCGKCPKRHGPYKYLTWREGGRVFTKYAGRA